MKKLMTMLSAVGLAIGAHAAGTWNSGETFESMTVGDDLDCSPTTCWVTNGTPELKVVAAENPAIAGSGYATQYKSTTHGKGLSIKTPGFQNPVYCTNSVGAKGMGTLYVDTLVKPTICDYDTNITLDSTAKIAIWFRASENESVTNLMVTAGYLTAGGTVVQTNYDCGTVEGADQWQRFTIKSFDNDGGTAAYGFVVFRNGDALVCADKKGDSNASRLLHLGTQARLYNDHNEFFPSLKQNEGTITAIGFDGTGEVDDILFTDYEETFAAPFKTFNLAWDDHVTGFTYQIGNTAAKTVSVYAAPGTNVLEVGTDPTTVTISSITYDTGYIADRLEASGTGIEVDGSAFKVYKSSADSTTCGTIKSKQFSPNVSVTIGGNTTTYFTLADAFDFVNTQSGAVTIQMANNSTAEGLAIGSALTLNGANLDSVTIDLDGQALTYEGEGYAITAAVPLTIIDSATGGSITAAEVVTNTTGLLTISAGTFNGKVAIGGTAAITGGTFTGTVAAESATGFITGGTFASKPTDSYVAYGYKASDSIPSTVAIGNWTITYYDDDGTELTGLEPTSYTFNTDVSFPTPSKSGYTFNRWEYENGTAFVYTKGTTIGNLELYASWTGAAVPTFTLTAAPGANMTVAVYTNDVVGVVGVNNDYTIASNDTAKIVYTAASGYKIEGQDTYTTNIVVEANVTVTAPTATASVTPIDPEKGGEQTYESAAEATAAANAINNDKEHLIAVDSSVIGEAKATYLSKVEAVADGTKVTIQFTTAAEAEVQAQADADNAALPLASIAAAAVSAEATVTATPGCYYTVESGTTPTALTAGTPVLATGTSVTLTIPNKGEAGFYKIKVSPTK